MKSYSMSCEVPTPVLFNCWKHHAGFIRWKIDEYKEIPEVHERNLTNEILLIGSSLMDLYIGEMTPAGIARSIMTYLNNKHVSGRENYRKWLYEMGDDYREVETDDESRWTLRLGEREERYVHIHPSRYSPHTIRVRSSSLKSAVLYCVMDGGKDENRLTQINSIRKRYLDLPPLKNMSSGSALYSLIRIFS